MRRSASPPAGRPARSPERGRRPGAATTPGRLSSRVPNAQVVGPSAAYIDSISLPVTLVAGTGIAVFDILWTTALAERIPPASLSRVSSYDWMISGGLLPLGYALAGPLAESLGAVEVMLGGSCLALVAFAFGLAPRETRMLERLAPGDTAARAEDPSLSLLHRY